jgi:hypothetical protein
LKETKMRERERENHNQSDGICNNWLRDMSDSDGTPKHLFEQKSDTKICHLNWEILRLIVLYNLSTE